MSAGFRVVAVLMILIVLLIAVERARGNWSR